MTQFLNAPDSDLPQFGLSSGAVAGDLVFAAGMALDTATMQRLPEARSIADEARICLDLLQETLQQAGCTFEDLVKVNCYLAEDSDRTEFWQTWDAIFADVSARIVRITQVVGIAGDCRVELDAIAIRPEATVKA